MSRSLKKKRHRSKNQRKCAQAALQKATAVCNSPLGEITNNTGSPSPSKIIHDLKHTTTTLKMQVERIKRQYWNERRRNNRLRKATEARKVDLKRAKNEAYILQGLVQSFEKKLGCVEQDAAREVQQLNERIVALENTRKDLNLKRDCLRRKCQQLQAAKHSFKRRAKEKLKLQPVTFKMMKKQRYTPLVRALACALVSAGAAEAKIGAALQEIGKALGVDINKRISSRSIGRFMLERGVAADIQLVYEILQSQSEYHKIRFSSLSAHSFS